MTKLPHLRGFQLVEDLGPSRLGHAYRATQLALGREVLIKIIDPELLGDPLAQARFRRGAAIAAKIHHKNVVSLYAVEVCPDSGLEFVALELVEGMSLEEVIARDGSIPEGRALKIGLGIAEALACLEDHRIVYRRLTPHSVQLDPGGSPKLSDLGLAKPVGEALTGPIPSLTRTPYTAPECSLGVELDSRADLYSLGVVLYELLSGRLPPDGAPADPRLHVSVRAETARFVAQLCEQAREARPPSAREAVEALRTLSAGFTAAAAPVLDPSAFLLNTGTDVALRELKIRAEIPDAEPMEAVFVRSQVMVGRGSDCDFRLPTPCVSRHHAEFSWQGGILWIIPHSTTNSTSVNGQKCTSPLPLHFTDRITLSGRVELQIDWGVRDAPEEESVVEQPGLPAESHSRRATASAGFPMSLARRGAARSTGGIAPRLFIPSQERVLAVGAFLQGGSSPSCELRLPPEAPRKALVVGWGSGGAWLLNVAPDASALHVNDEPITDRCGLRSGDRISLYGLTLIYQEGYE